MFKTFINAFKVKGIKTEIIIHILCSHSSQAGKPDYCTGNPCRCN